MIVKISKNLIFKSEQIFKVILSTVLVLSCVNVFSQSTIENYKKYLDFRDKLKNKFLEVGSIPGGSIPGDIIINFNTIDWADQGYHLGWYIGVLATEYKLYKENGFDLTQTKKELYYALYAFNRMDLHAEVAWGGTASLNGFIVRDDVHIGFQNNFDNNITKVIGACIGLDKENDFAMIEKTCTEQSQDQTYPILLGMALVNKFVDAYDNYNGLAFQDGQINFVDEARKITDRVITHFNSLWIIKNPVTGNNVDQGPFATLFSYAIAEAGNKITGENYHNAVSIANRPTWNVDLQLTPFAHLNADNIVFILELAAIGDSWRTLLINTTGASIFDHSKDNDWYIYNLLHSALHDKNNPVDITTYTDMLNSLTCKGPYSFQNGDKADGGWASPMRWIQQKRNQEFGKTDFEGEYNALDYMLLFNLYHIFYKNDLPSLSSLKDVYINYDLPLGFSGTNIFPAYIRAIETITSVKRIEADFPDIPGHPFNGNATFIAGKEIDLLPGFEVEIGAEFYAYIDELTCINGQLQSIVFVDPSLSSQNEFADIEPSHGKQFTETKRQEKNFISKNDYSAVLHPNPLIGNKGVITYAVKESGNIKISIIDMFGKALAVLVDNPKHEAGEFQADFELLNFPSGIYYYKMEAPGFSIAKKMVVLK